MDHILDNDAAQAGGWLTVGGSILMTVVEFFGVSINDVLQGIVSVGGIVFLWYKIKNARLDSKLKKRKLEETPDNQKE
jgi:hypothetical protein